jgi:hypothetical protein
MDPRSTEVLESSLIDSQFGVEDGPWDWNKTDMSENKKRLAKAEEKFTTLRKNVNLNVMDMIDR